MPAATPAKDPEFANRVMDLHAAGKGRNEIARALHVTTYAVDRVCAFHGLGFNAERTRAAVEVATASAGEQRRQLAGRFRNAADQAMTGAEDSTDDPDQLFRWLKAAGTAVDKDLAIQDQLDRDNQDGEQQNVAEQFLALGSMIRDAAVRQDAPDQPAEPSDRDEPP